MPFSPEFLLPALTIIGDAMLREISKQAIINAVESVKQMATRHGVSLDNKDVTIMKRALADNPGKWRCSVSIEVAQTGVSGK
jgi:hypothetical protein